MYGIKTFPMKKNYFLSLAAVAAFALTASAAQNETQSTPLALPTYVVESGRLSPAEQEINRSLSALRDLARTPITVSMELPALKAQVAGHAKIVSAARLAKF